MKKTLIIASLFSALIASEQVHASSLPDTVLKAYQEGMRGNAEQNTFAVNALEKIYQEQANPVVLSLLGSAESAKAQYTDKPWQKMKLVEKGMAKLTKAVKQAQRLPYPVQARVNVTAGCTFVQVPKMMNRTEQGNYLLQQVINNKSEFNKLDIRLKKSAYRCAVSGAKKADNQELAEQYLTMSNAISDPSGTVKSGE